MAKCRYCGKQIKPSEAYKVVVGKSNTYYCDELEYDLALELKKQKTKKHEVNNEERDAILAKVDDIFEYHVTVGQLKKSIITLHKSYSYQQILEYLNSHFNYLHRVMTSKSFSSETGKVKYLAAIIRNSLSDQIQEIQPIKRDPVIVEVDIPNMKYKQKKQRRGLIEIEKEVIN